MCNEKKPATDCTVEGLVLPILPDARQYHRDIDWAYAEICKSLAIPARLLDTEFHSTPNVTRNVYFDLIGQNVKNQLRASSE